MNFYRIKTTAHEEEDIVIATNLSEENIIDIITPIVTNERDGGEVYDNEMLVEALASRYKKAKIIHINQFQTIVI
jgi:hypothetical protein